MGYNGQVCIGLSQTSPDRKSNYGIDWKHSSHLCVGYHGDDGKIYHGDYQNSVPILGNGPYHIANQSVRYKSGDVIGVFLERNMVLKEKITILQFTKNGTKVHNLISKGDVDWYPTIKIRSPKAIVETNFGDTQFLFRDV